MPNNNHVSFSCIRMRSAGEAEGKTVRHPRTPRGPLCIREVERVGRHNIKPTFSLTWMEVNVFFEVLIKGGKVDLFDDLQPKRSNDKINLN